MPSRKTTKAWHARLPGMAGRHEGTIGARDGAAVKMRPGATGDATRQTPA
ncbi:MAG: hypothetical protein GYA24_02675 [Candidatus Lokiarchaeota archaeon]|nr:hypothetical protein [Candidatus Lokiarchaeota archaeon]